MKPLPRLLNARHSTSTAVPPTTGSHAIRNIDPVLGVLILLACLILTQCSEDRPSDNGGNAKTNPAAETTEAQLPDPAGEPSAPASPGNPSEAEAWFVTSDEGPSGEAVSVPAPAVAEPPATRVVREGVGEVEEALIKKATAGMAATYAVGWQYSGNDWQKGESERAEVGQEASSEPKDDVRAVCLGKENVGGRDYFVFFALRSFVDPFYPSPVIQGLQDIHPLDRGGNPIRLEDFKTLTERNSGDESKRGISELIRYGRIDFVWYESLGGGPRNPVEAKVTVTVFHDPDEVRVIKGNRFWHPKEEYEGGIYPRPHTHFSVEDHFQMRDASRSGVDGRVRFYDDHDAVLVYVPEQVFLDQGQRLPPSLGLEHPTLAVDVLLRRPVDLFGFEFVLVGQKTLDEIRAYRPHDFRLTGYEKMAGIVGLAMSPNVLSMFKTVDSILDAALPDPRRIPDWAALMNFYLTLDNADLADIGLQLVRQRTSRR